MRRHLTYANVVSSVCLFIVLGGTSYGLATGFIDSREIKNDTVRSRDIRNNEVRSVDLRDRTLTGRDLANNTVGPNAVNEGELGKVPSAVAADTAVSALTLNGIPPNAFGLAPVTAATDVPDGEAANVLTIPGVGALSTPEGGAGCDLGDGELGLNYDNSAAGTQDLFVLFVETLVNPDHLLVPPAGSQLLDFSGAADGVYYARLAVRQAGSSKVAALVDLFAQVGGDAGDNCRIVARADLAG